MSTNIFGQYSHITLGQYIDVCTIQAMCAQSVDPTLPCHDIVCPIGASLMNLNHILSDYITIIH